MYTLGINATFHDSAACLVKDGIPLVAAEEERFSRIKHAKRPTPYNTFQLPFEAIDFCLRQAGIGLAELDHVAYAFDPTLLFPPRAPWLGKTAPLEATLIIDPQAQQPPSSPWETIFPAGIAAAPRMLVDDVPFYLKARFGGCKPQPPYRFHFVEHHLAHAASAFLCSPFEEAAILTADGRGETSSTLLAWGKGKEITKLREIQLPHSLGLLYEEVTSYLGFQPSNDEYKVMALASYGRPIYLDEFHAMITLESGGYRIEDLHLIERFGPARVRGGPLEARHYHIAASLQVTLEETMLHLAEWLKRETGADNLCLAGGVALNCVLNARLRDAAPFSAIFVQPAASDDGTALGAALWVDGQQRPGGRVYEMTNTYLGPAFDDAAIQAVLDRAGLSYERPPEIALTTARAIAQGAVVGWFQGRMEFGPRALGARSILATPTDPEMVQRLNELKDREDFRPVAPAVLEEAAAEYFVGATKSPFMLFTFPVKKERAHLVPAIRHVDGSARIQTVSRSESPLYYRVIEEFAKLTGIPVVVNTSFNTRGKPIVCTPEDALACFFTAPIDALAIGSFWLKKERQGPPTSSLS